LAEGKAKVGGVVTHHDSTTKDVEAATTGNVLDSEEEQGNVPNTFSNNWKLNLALAVVTCWFSMALTSWGSIQADGTVTNPQVGKVNMWIIIASQWVALLLCAWTLLLAPPQLFPD
jgi:hypothetical protein